MCRSLAARHLLLPAGQLVPERWENTSLTIADGPAPWRIGEHTHAVLTEVRGSTPARVDALRRAGVIAEP